MKAALFYGPNEPLRIEEVEKPSPGNGEILVRVKACGVCHTDLHYVDHGVPTFKEPPVILGHEASGTVEELGVGVEGFKEGDRVLIPPVFTCGTCQMCRTGRENICENMRMVGNHLDGAYAEYMVAPQKDTIPLPEEVPLEEGCVVSDAVSTPFHALMNRAHLRAGDKVALFGCGGLGLNAIQIAKAMGSFVVAIDVKEKKLEYASSFGADVVLLWEEGIAKKIRRLTGGGVDVAVEAIGNPSVMRASFSSLRTGGKLIIMGYSEKDLVLSAGRVMFREMEILGSLGCPPYLYPRLLEMVKRGSIRVKELVTHRFPLDEINDALSLLREGDESLIRAIILP